MPGGGEDRRLDASTLSILRASGRPAAGRRARRRGRLRWCAGGGAALTGRTAGRWAGLTARARPQARRAYRTAGARRGRSSALAQPPRPGRCNPRRAASRPLSPPVSPAAWVRPRAGRRRGGLRQWRDRGPTRRRAQSPLRRAAGSPGRTRRPTPPDFRPGSRIFVAISGMGRAQRKRRARIRSAIQRASTSASGDGASGQAANAKAAAWTAAETGSSGLFRQLTEASCATPSGSAGVSWQLIARMRGFRETVKLTGVGAGC